MAILLVMNCTSEVTKPLFQVNICFAAVVKLYKFCTFLQRSSLRISASFVFQNTPRCVIAIGRRFFGTEPWVISKLWIDAVKMYDTYSREARNNSRSDNVAVRSILICYRLYRSRCLQVSIHSAALLRFYNELSK